MPHSEYQQQIRNHLRTAYLLSNDRIEEVLPRFVASLESLMDDLERLSVTGNTDALNRAGHAMKGALLNMGLQRIAAIAFSIEKFKPSATENADLARNMAELREELRKII